MYASGGGRNNQCPFPLLTVVTLCALLTRDLLAIAKLFVHAARRTYITTSNYWIALYKLSPTVNSTTQWFDGNPSTFRNWSSGEPDEINRCFVYDAGGFADTNCSYIHHFMCKKPGSYHKLSLQRKMTNFDSVKK